MNRFSQKVIIISRNLDDFSLVNQGQSRMICQIPQTFSLPNFPAIQYTIFISYHLKLEIFEGSFKIQYICLCCSTDWLFFLIWYCLHNLLHFYSPQALLLAQTPTIVKALHKQLKDKSTKTRQVKIKPMATFCGCIQGQVLGEVIKLNWIRTVLRSRLIE